MSTAPALKTRADSDCLIVPISMIDHEAYKNARLYEGSVEDKKKILDSIKGRAEAGESPLINPITVGPLDEEAAKCKKGTYPLKAGFTRRELAILAGLKEIQVKIDKTPFQDVNAQENLGRNDLHVAEVVNIIGRYVDAGLDAAAIAGKVKLSISHVKNYMRVYACTPVWEAWRDSVAEPKTHDIALTSMEVIKMVGDHNNELKACHAKLDLQKYELNAEDVKAGVKENSPEAKKKYEAARESDKRADAIRLREKYRNRMQNIIDKRAEAKAQADKDAAKGNKAPKGPKEGGRSRPSIVKMNSEREELKFTLKYAQGLKTSPAKLEAIAAIEAAIDTLKWAGGEIKGQPTKKIAVIADMLVAARKADTKK